MVKVTNEDLLKEIIKSKEQKKITETLGKMMMWVADHVGNRPQYVNSPFRDDMVQEAIMQMSRSYMTFNPERSNSPLAFLLQATSCSFVGVMAKEKKQLEITKDYEQTR